MPVAETIRLPGEIDNTLLALEARDIARRIGRAARPVWPGIDLYLARGENILTKWFLTGVVRRATAMTDPDKAAEWLDRVRTRTAGGSFSILPHASGPLAMVKPMLPVDLQSAVAVGPDAEGTRQLPDPAKPVLFYVAGGGFILPPTPRQRAIAEKIADGFGAQPVLGMHRLAPEHAYPVPVEDLCAHYLSLLAAGLPPQRVVVAGDSAGATLIVSMLLALRDAGHAMPAGALLFSPWTDLALRGWSYVTKGVSSDSPFRMETAAFAARLYLGDTLPTDPGASPAYADFTGLPPIAIHCSRYDMHFDDAVRLAEQADEANVPVRVNYWESPRHHLERFRSRDGIESIKLAAATARQWTAGRA